MNKALIFGTNNTACGILGQASFQSGLQTTFVSHLPHIIDTINENSGYFLKLIERGTHYMSIRDCEALHFDEHKKIVNAIADAQVVMTAVGVNNLQVISPYLTAGMVLRKRKGHKQVLNIIACEGLPGTSEYLYHQLLTEPAFKADVELKNLLGFASAMSNRIVLGGEIEHGELTYTADRRSEIIIDGKFLKGSSLPLSDVAISNDFTTQYLQNQYTLNCALNSAAYLGYQKSCDYIHEAVAHPELFSILNGAVHEAQSALVSKFPKQLTNIIKQSKFAMMRLRQKDLNLHIEDIGRQPRQKLKAQECLVGPLLLAHHFGLPYGNLAKVVAATLCYDASEAAQDMQSIISHYGIDKILSDDCSLPPYHPVVAKIKSEYSKMHNHGKKESIYQGLRGFSHSFFNF